MKQTFPQLICAIGLKCICAMNVGVWYSRRFQMSQDQSKYREEAERMLNGDNNKWKEPFSYKLAFEVLAKVLEDNSYLKEAVDYWVAKRKEEIEKEDKADCEGCVPCLYGCEFSTCKLGKEKQKECEEQQEKMNRNPLKGIYPESEKLGWAVCGGECDKTKRLECELSQLRCVLKATLNTAQAKKISTLDKIIDNRTELVADLNKENIELKDNVEALQNQLTEKNLRIRELEEKSLNDKDEILATLSNLSSHGLDNTDCTEEEITYALNEVLKYFGEKLTWLEEG
jgi:hypothetical protein